MQVAGVDTEHLLVTESMSLSRSGVSCRTAEFIAPLSKVDLTLILPPFGALSKSPRRMSAEGVVVRCDRVPEEERTGDEQEYDVACCFTSLDGESKSLLEAYVAWKLLRSAHAGEERAATHGRPAAAARGMGGSPSRPPRRHGGRQGPRRGSPRGPGPGGRGGRGGGRRGGGARRTP
jgi:hypothetical protein